MSLEQELISKQPFPTMFYFWSTAWPYNRSWPCSNRTVQNQTGSVGTRSTQTHFNHRFRSYTTSLSRGEPRQAGALGSLLGACSTPSTLLPPSATGLRAPSWLAHSDRWHLTIGCRWCVLPTSFWKLLHSLTASNRPSALRCPPQPGPIHPDCHIWAGLLTKIPQNKPKQHSQAHLTLQALLAKPLRARGFSHRSGFYFLGPVRTACLKQLPCWP